MSDGNSRKKYKHLTVLQRLHIVKQLQENVSPKTLAEDFGVRIQTIYNIKKHAASLLREVDKHHHLHKKAKKIKGPVLRELDNKLFIWFSEQNAMGNAISDKHLQQKAEEINMNCGGPSTFACNRAWLWRFKKRHGICSAQMAGESSGADSGEAAKFSATFWKLVEDENLSLSNVYNMDETGLMWKSLPQNDLVSAAVQKLNGDQMKKERITIGFCANVTGTHKLPLLLIDKPRKSRAPSHFGTLQMMYEVQKNAWMNRNIFRDWYENFFKPAVRAQHLRTGKAGKVILLVDNCSAHILPSDAVNDDHFELMYFPPNVMPIIQPMEQGLIAKIKLRYRFKLADKVSEYPGGLALFYKQYTLNDCIEILNIYWEEMTEQNIRSSWKHVLGNNHEETEADGTGDTENNSENSSMAKILQNCPETAVTEKVVKEWFAFCETEEAQICNETGNEEKKDDDEKGEDEDGEKAEENVKELQDEDVAKALDTIVQWTKQFDLSVQVHANALQAFFYEGKKDL